MWCPAGAATAISCRSSPRPECCPSPSTRRTIVFSRRSTRDKRLSGASARLLTRGVDPRVLSVVAPVASPVVAPVVPPVVANDVAVPGAQEALSRLPPALPSRRLLRAFLRGRARRRGPAPDHPHLASEGRRRH